MPEKKILKINQSYIESWYKAAVVNHWSGVKFYQLEYIKMFFFIYDQQYNKDIKKIQWKIMLKHINLTNINI